MSEEKRYAPASETVPVAADQPRRKILFTASTMSHIENFHLPYLRAFKEMGWEVKAVALPVSKSFFNYQNIRAIFSTRRLLLSEGFDVISSQSTLAGIVTRLAVMLAGKAVRNGASGNAGRSGNPARNLKVFHTAHGYLFHDDKSLKKWAYLIPEIICAKVTDVLMVMNHEDLEIAKKYKLAGKSGKIYYINGMGIDLSRFRDAQGEPIQATKEQKEAFGIGENDFVFVYAAEFSKRKNHELLLKGFARALKEIKSLEIKKMKLVLAGDGVLLEKTKALASELNIQDRVIFPGYVKKIPELYTCCDAAVSTSRIEGLPFNIMEAMACGLPVIASDTKGHRELIEHGVNGLLFESEKLSNEIILIYLNSDLRNVFSNNSQVKIGAFSLNEILPLIMDYYKINTI